jgi:formate hydrogenlyase subunit 3/multisubunit Na+/H+ antiporter MnhD subunit
MKTGIIGSFSLSALLFILSFLTREDGGYMSVVLLFFGIAVAVAGILMAMQENKKE